MPRKKRPRIARLDQAMGRLSDRPARLPEDPTTPGIPEASRAKLRMKLTATSTGPPPTNVQDLNASTWRRGRPAVRRRNLRFCGRTDRVAARRAGCFLPSSTS